MKRFLYAIMLAALWFAGGIFFFFLSAYVAISFLTGGIKKIFKRKGLYHFREEEFSALNLLQKEKNIRVGKLPANKGETFTYTVPIEAKEILLEFKFGTHGEDKCVEFDYCLSSNDTAARKEFIYIFINPFDSMKLSYDRALVWYPVPADRILKVQFTDIKPFEDAVKNLEGHLNVIQVR